MQNILIYLALVCIMLQAGGCGVLPTPPGESRTPAFGSSVNTALAEQTANPEAGGDAPVVGLNGRYGAAAAAKYEQGPREKQDIRTGSIFGIVEGK